MLAFPVKIPIIIKRLFPKYIWEKTFSNKTLYLTFDDGPTPEITEWTLNTLKQFNAKATFFCIGDNVKKYPDILHKINQEGHSIGNHTFNHINGWSNKTNSYVNNTEKAQNTLEKELGLEYFSTKKLFRPPYGKIKNKQARQLIKKGYQIVMWSVISYDWNINLSGKDCLNNVLKHTKDGNIIVFHDSLKAKKNLQYTLPKVLSYYSDRGYSFKSL